MCCAKRWEKLSIHLVVDETEEIGRKNIFLYIELPNKSI